MGSRAGQGREWLGMRGERQAGARPQGPLETKLRIWAFTSASRDTEVSDMCNMFR